MLVLNVGLHSSASTWVANIIQGLHRAAFPLERLLSAYADNLCVDSPLSTHTRYDSVLLKSHHPSQAFALLTACGAARTVMTMRDPRDCVVSLMHRFNRDFQQSLSDVLSSLAYIDAIPSDLCMLLKYEDRFPESRDTIRDIARHLGWRADEDTVQRLFDALAIDEVRQHTDRIAHLPPQRRRQRSDSIMDIETGFHTNHVTDGRSGKFHDALTTAQLRVANGLLAFHLNKFGYADGPLGLPIDCFRLSGNVAVNADCATFSNPSEGEACPVYGPYMFLPVGRWLVELLVSSVPEGAFIECDVFAQETVFASRREQISGSDRPVRLEFIIPGPDLPIEFRIKVAPRTDVPIFFKGATLTRLPA